MDSIEGFFAPWLVAGLTLALHLLFPARKVEGYVREIGRAHV